ncbi:hypothetical protein D8674_011607 [Pyrus ussuriensis x Pyrus communis]|uniref:Uncharacterized protein n=1 Tax=Pyrus ussuriensis x Pyrus communis TaxID=2448454 RepID=A0A5N5FZ71_9ROSA|nr:hypothetical protein D8674_011607 [Pyrus ussuriensis x Pyrus communis]
MIKINKPEGPPIMSKKGSKKRAPTMDLNPPTLKDILEIGKSHGEASDVVLVDDDLNVPTMGEKQESLELLDNERPESHDKEESSLDPKPPSADSVYILLKQALHADDYALLLDYTTKMRSMTITVNVDYTTGVLGHCKVSLTAESIWCLKLLQSLICIIQ